MKEALVAALQVDYPSQLLTVYRCDDGKDLAKRHVVSQLRNQYRNVHYVIRPKHEHAKAGNLNYAIERSQSDLIVTLDADFVARPNLLQRLVPYYYVWNPTLGMYEFNNTLAFVQTPQFYRNLSPYDSDLLDQRSIFFFDIVIPGKDWFNASTMVGTTNLINRGALKKAKFYPYHSITEDSALSIIFHGLGFRSYYVKESLPTGLATTALWANLRQRARWLKGDWQILFSRHGPLADNDIDEQISQEHHQHQHLNGGQEFPPETVNMSPPVATLPPFSNNRPPLYPYRGPFQANEQSLTQQRTYNSSQDREESVDRVVHDAQDDDEHGSWLAVDEDNCSNMNQTIRSTTKATATLTSPPMTRTGTNLMGAISEQNDEGVCEECVKQKGNADRKFLKGDFFLL